MARVDRHIWLTMEDNETTKDEFDVYWKDVMTFPINKFRFDNTPEEIVLTEQSILRMDLLTFEYYETTDYDDIILWLNNIKYKNELTPGDKFLMPDKADIERFFTDYIL